MQFESKPIAGAEILVWSLRESQTQIGDWLEESLLPGSYDFSNGQWDCRMYAGATVHVPTVEGWDIDNYHAVLRADLKQRLPDVDFLMLKVVRWSDNRIIVGSDLEDVYEILKRYEPGPHVPDTETYFYDTHHYYV